jgi:uncharacterized membrane protein YcjF (UPF0283 family)
MVPTACPQRKPIIATKLSNTGKPKYNAEAFMPPLLTFGPVFMWMGLNAGLITAFNRPDWFAFGLATAGTMMLSAGLGLLLRKQARLEQRLNELERLKN